MEQSNNKTFYEFSFVIVLQEWHDMELMQEENTRIREEIEALRSKYDALKRFAVMKNIPLPHELEIMP